MRINNGGIIMKSNNEMYQECIELLNQKIAERNDLNRQISELLVKRTELEMIPFKNGDVVAYEINIAGSVKWRKCKCEIDKATGELYVRLFKTDGELGDRRQRVFRKLDQKYADVLREWKE